MRQSYYLLLSGSKWPKSSTRIHRRAISIGAIALLFLPFGVIPSKKITMSILTWNCRGGAHPEFIKAITDLVSQHKPMLIFIIETRLPAVMADDLKVELKYDSVHGVDSNGLSGGIWMIWDSTRISVDILPHGNQAIHVLVQEAFWTDSSSEDGACFS